MLNKLLREIVVIVVGKQAEGIAELLNSKKHENEFIIAKKMELTINQTRNILYKISNVGLVSSIRKKDKKKGWYTYFWKFEILKSLRFLRNILNKKRMEIEKEVSERESNTYYFCKRCNIEVGGEEALLMDFTCAECGDVFVVKENVSLVKELKRTLTRIGEKLKFVNEEIEKEKLRLDKIKAKELKKMEEEKQEKRKISAAKRKKTRMQTLKDAAKKKPIKKKTVKKKAAKKKVVRKKKAAKKKVVKKKKPMKKSAKRKPSKKKASKNKPVKKKVVKRKPTKNKPVKKKTSKKKAVKKKR